MAGVITHTISMGKAVWITSVK